MRYVIQAKKQEDLERLVADEELDVLYQAKNIPYLSVQTALAPKELAEKYPDYTISEEITYDTKN